MLKIFLWPAFMCLFLTVYTGFSQAQDTSFDADPAQLFAQAEAEAEAEAEADPERALVAYCMAARSGSAAAQLHLGRIYAAGEGVAQNMPAAMLWYDMALVNGAPEARELRKKAGLRATPEDFTRYRAYNNNRGAIPCETSARP